MRGEQDLEDALVQNLQDAGCEEYTIKKFQKLFLEDKIEEILALLLKHRDCLLNELRKSQKEIDYLDYLILDLKKKVK